MKKAIRKQVYELIPKNSRVIDIGCGKGKLLYELSDKIKYGLGIDINKRKIKIANKNSKSNLEFKLTNSKNESFDIAIAMFSIHSMDYKTQIKTLKNMSKIAKKIILIDYVKPDSFLKKALIYIDEHLAGHYNNFKNYKEIGMEKLISKSGLKINKEIKNKLYSIWICG